MSQVLQRKACTETEIQTKQTQVLVPSSNKGNLAETEIQTKQIKVLVHSSNKGKLAETEIKTKQYKQTKKPCPADKSKLCK